MDIIKYIIAKFFFMATPKRVVGCLGDVTISRELRERSYLRRVIYVLGPYDIK